MLSFSTVDVFKINELSNDMLGRRVLSETFNKGVYLLNMSFTRAKEFMPELGSVLYETYDDLLLSGTKHILSDVLAKTSLNQGTKLKPCIILVDIVNTDTISDEFLYNGSFDLNNVCNVYHFMLYELKG